MKAAVIENYMHLAPTGKGWIEGLKGCGWDATKHYPGEPVPDDVSLAVYMDGVDGVAPMIDSIERRPDRMNVVVLSQWPKFDIARACDRVDLFVSHTIIDKSLDMLIADHHRSVAHIPFGASERFFSPNDRVIPPAYDVAFIGTRYHGSRDWDRYMEPLLACKDLKVFHLGTGTRFLEYPDTRKLYDLTKVCINFHYPDQKEPHRVELNGRTFDLALMGACQVVDHLPGQFAGLGIPVHSTVWLDVIRDLVKDDDARDIQKSIAMLTAANHTWTVRMRAMLYHLSVSEWRSHADAFAHE